jgi:hypothetical protein
VAGEAKERLRESEEVRSDVIHLPRYPLYVISKGRADVCLTARFLLREGVPFRLVVEKEEFDSYAENLPGAKIEVLPFSNLGLGGIPARNWVWEHAKKSGAERHWILDDNIGRVRRMWKGKRYFCDSGPVFASCEDFADRYENIAVLGLNYSTFARPGTPPFYPNVHVYSCLLIKNDLTNRWRGRYNEDTDLCLQVLADGWCTALINAFMIDKIATMTMKGGNTSELYKGDGRLKMARSLEKMWPGVVTTTRRFRRPQHYVDWSKFTTPLRPRAGVRAKSSNEYGLAFVDPKP